jgi:hypothetical protein
MLRLLIFLGSILIYQQLVGQSIKTAKIDYTGSIDVLFVFNENKVKILLEKRLNDQWVTLDSIDYNIVTIESPSSPTSNNIPVQINYTVSVPLDTGLNGFKISTINEFQFLEIYSSKRINIEDYRKKDFINFTQKTDYSLRNGDGIYLQEGYVPFINIKRLEKGRYFLKINRNNIIEFLK